MLEGLVNSFTVIGGKVVEVSNKLDPALEKIEPKEFGPLADKVKSFYEEYSIMVQYNHQIT
jgi:archaellum biogenesis protein FlaJ (TadC family)